MACDLKLLCVLVILLLPLSLGYNYRDKPCWTEIDNNGYYGLTRMYAITGLRKCKSYCFDWNQIGSQGGCNVWTIYQFIFHHSGYFHCYVAHDNKPNLTPLFYSILQRTKVLKGKCEYRNCWSALTAGTDEIKKLDMRGFKIANKVRCRFYCMEIPGCLHASFQEENRCYLQIEKPPKKSKPNVTVFGKVYKLKPLCKSESCWEMHIEYDVTWTALEEHYNKLNAWECKIVCLKLVNCYAFKWEFNKKRCFVMNVAARKHSDFVAPVAEGVITWEMKYRCHDFDWQGTPLNH